MGYVVFRVIVERPLPLVFAVYAQPQPWRWSDIRSVRWVRGKPWEIDSRLRMEPRDAFGVVVDQVLTHFEVNRRVEFISHFGGVTMLSEVLFRPLSDSQTEIESRLEFVGTFSRIAGFAIGPAIERGAQGFYQQLKRECEGLPLAETPVAQADGAVQSEEGGG
jgi:hypothetical protein